MAGNNHEWTIELSSIYGAMLRGSYFGDSGFYAAACFRGGSSLDINGSREGFRPILYIK